jgi:hypothetical protein
MWCRMAECWVQEEQGRIWDKSVVRSIIGNMPAAASLVDACGQRRKSSFGTSDA